MFRTIQQLLLGKKPSQTIRHFSTEESSTKIYRAFLIRGGTRPDRWKKLGQLDDEINCTAFFENKDELVFLNHNADVKNMTMADAKKLAGTEKVSETFKTEMLNPENNITRGIIDLPSNPPSKPKMR